MNTITNEFFYGGKFDVNYQNKFPLSPKELKRKSE